MNKKNTQGTGKNDQAKREWLVREGTFGNYQEKGENDEIIGVHVNATVDSNYVLATLLEGPNKGREFSLEISKIKAVPRTRLEELMALAGRPVSDVSSRQNDRPVLYGQTGRDDTRLKVTVENGGNLYPHTAVLSENPLGTAPLMLKLKPLGSRTDPVFDKEGQPTGKFITSARYVIVIE